MFRLGVTYLSWVLYAATLGAIGCGGSSNPTSPDGGRAKDGASTADRPPRTDAVSGDARSATADATTDATDATTGITCGFPMPNPASVNLPNPASYDTSTTGVVVDNVSGLMWEQAARGQTVTEGCAADKLGFLTCPNRYAVTYCAALRAGGYSDWRLPTVLELYSLTDFTLPAPTIDLTAFPETPSSSFWTVTRQAGHLDNAWLINFKLGGDTIDFIDNPHPVRCVRAGMAPPSRCYPTAARYQVQNGLVSDAATGLTWQATGPDSLSYPNAGAYCAGLVGGFRLPSIKELFTIARFTNAGGSGIDTTVFGNDYSDWSSSPVLGTGNGIWVLAYDIEMAGATPAMAATGDGTDTTRCVR